MTRRELANAEQQVNGQLIESFVAQAFQADGRAVEGMGLERPGFFGVVLAKVPGHCAIVGMDFGEQGLYLFVRVELRGLFFQDEVCAYTATRKVLNALDVFCAVGVRVEVT